MTNNVIPINAFPSKKFFIDMATKDVSISEAILELVDNSIDAAKKDISQHPDKTLGNYYVDIRFTRNKDVIERLVIEDNCGGMDISTAMNAFKSGYFKENSEIVKNSIGVFGVGMKRSIYKLGKQINIYSETKADGAFQVSIDSEIWKENDDEWMFYLDRKNTSILKEHGFKIEINSFYDEVINFFALDSEIYKLGEFLKTYLSLYINEGFIIKLNGTMLTANNQYVLDNAIVKSALYKYEAEDISYKIIAGITEHGDPEKAGWYVYCNGRALLTADKTSLTGWNDISSQTNESDKELIFSPTYERFRGFVLFEAKNPKFLPVNTTKIGIDINSPKYIQAQTQMKNMTKEVIKTFKELDVQAKKIIETYTVKRNSGEFLKITNEEVDKIIKNINTCRLFMIDASALLAKRDAVGDDSIISFSYPKKSLDKLRNYFDIDNDSELMKKLLSIAAKDYLEE